MPPLTSPSEPRFAAGEQARVQEVLADLAPSDRLLLLERYGAATPLRELAAASDCTERTVRNRLQRALEKLTQALLRTPGASS